MCCYAMRYLNLLDQQQRNKQPLKLALILVYYTAPKKKYSGTFQWSCTNFTMTRAELNVLETSDYVE